MKILILLTVMLALTADVQAFHTEGKASWYGHESGRFTASGERFNPHGMSAASWFYPFGTLVRVQCIKTGKCVTVRINDRGPAKRLGRLIDLSEAAAKKLGMLRSGIKKVKIEVIATP
jgi:rare lipoprotein A